MSRRRAPTGPAISLFPFLAVLLCTMGALLVLLVLFSRSAQQADATAAAEAARLQQEEAEERTADLALLRDELAWRLEQLRGVRDKTAADLAEARLRLAGIEEGGRALADELAELERTASALDAAADDGGDEADEAVIEDLERQLAEARGALEAAREDAADRPPAYAVVPYEGKAGTHRRPLYIECCIDGVFLQPEGIRLGPADFEGPPGPGNPLASGLRAAREYLATRSAASGEPEAQPYPLLLVRPSGVMAYYAARESLQSWGSDFGYQFIDEDWTLTFPPADPALAEVEARAVAEARQRLEWLAQVRPRERTKPAVQYRASTTRGGVVATGGPTVLGDQSRFDWTEEQAAAALAGRGFRAGGGEGGDGRGDAILGNGTGAGDADTRWTAGGPGGGGPAGGAAGDRYLGPSKFYGGSGSGQPGGTGSGDFGPGPHGGDENSAAGGSEAAGGESLFGGSGTPVGEPGSSDSAFGDPQALAAAGASGGGGASASEDAPGIGPGSAAAAGGGDGSGGTAGGEGGGGGGATASPDGAGGGGGGSFGPALPGMAQGQAAAAGGGSAGSCPGGDCSLANQRGSNWASLASRDRPIPLTRPIRLECAADEFRILGSGGRVARRVPVSAETAAAVDPLVREVHATVGGWGMAGDGMYWKPELVLTATPDGTARRDDLEKLLADSGLDTRRAGETDAVRSLPPVRRTGGLFRAR